MTIRDYRAVDTLSPDTYGTTSTADEGYKTDPCNNLNNSYSSSRWSGYLTKNHDTPKATKYRPLFKTSSHTSHPYYIPQGNGYNPIREQKPDYRGQRQTHSPREIQNHNPSPQNKLVHVSQSSLSSQHYPTDFERHQNQSGLTSPQTFPEDPFSKVAPLSVRDYDKIVRKHAKTISTNQQESPWGNESMSSSRLQNVLETRKSSSSNLNNTSVYFGGSERTKPTPRKVARLSNQPSLFLSKPMTSCGNILCSNSSFDES